MGCADRVVRRLVRRVARRAPKNSVAAVAVASVVVSVLAAFGRGWTKPEAKKQIRKGRDQETHKGKKL